MKNGSVEIKRYRLEDLCIGQEASFIETIGDSDIDKFAVVSGDVNPLHMNLDFAKQMGYSGRVVHGAYLTGLVSRMVGVYLPGLNSLLSSINIKFRAPVISGSSVNVIGVVDQISAAVNVIVLKVKIVDSNTKGIHATAEVMVRINK